MVQWVTIWRSPSAFSLQARIPGAVPKEEGLPHRGWGTEGQRALPWAKRRSWSFGNCAAVLGAAVPSPAGASAAAEGLGGESETQGGGGCPRATASTAGEGSLLRWGAPASESCWEMSWSKAAAMAGLMSWPGWVSDPACWAFPWRRADGGGPGGEGGRCSADGGTWLDPSGFLFDAAPSEGAKQDRGHNVRHQDILIQHVDHLYNNSSSYWSSFISNLQLRKIMFFHQTGLTWSYTMLTFLPSPQEGEQSTLSASSHKYGTNISVGNVAIKLTSQKCGQIIT